MKKLLAIFFAFALVFTMLPGLAAAEGTEGEEEQTVQEETDLTPDPEDSEPGDPEMEEPEPEDPEAEEPETGLVSVSRLVVTTGLYEGYSFEFTLAELTVDEAEAITVDLYRDDLKLATNELVSWDGLEGLTGLSSPFALTGFDYEADGYWANTWHEPKDVVPNKGVVTVVVEDETFTGDIAVDLDEEAEAIVPDPDPEDPPALLPDSPFYFLKRFVENVRIFFTFNEDNRDELKAELAEERAKELAALEQKYIDEELTEKEIEMFTKLAEELKEYSEGFLDRFADLDEEELESLELTEEEVAKVEKAMDNLGEALDWLGDGKGDDDEDEDEEGNYDKYERRIAHLEQIMEKTPDAANFGLSRAIENARRQQARWIARYGSPEDEEEPEEQDVPEDHEDIDEEDLTEGNGNDTTDPDKEVKDKDKKDKSTPPGQAKKEDVRDKVREANDSWKPGDGKPPWAGGPGGRD